jgi:hypothetical protein
MNRACAAAPPGSPAAQRITNALRALGVTAASIAAGVKWWRAEQRREERERERAATNDTRPVLRVGPERRAIGDTMRQVDVAKKKDRGGAQRWTVQT